MVPESKPSTKKSPPPVPPKSDKTYLLLNQQENKTKIEENYIKNPQNTKTTADQIVKRHRDTKKKRMNDADAREKLKMIASPGDPNEKYILKEKLGSGFVNISKKI